jgi:hypothetical protein
MATTEPPQLADEEPEAAGLDLTDEPGGEEAAAPAGERTAAAAKAAAAPRRASRCEPSPCQVPGCTVQLRPGQARPYLLRYRLCAPHLASSEVEMPFGTARFCHKVRLPPGCRSRPRSRRRALARIARAASEGVVVFVFMLLMLRHRYNPTEFAPAGPLGIRTLEPIDQSLPS